MRPALLRRPGLRQRRILRTPWLRHGHRLPGAESQPERQHGHDGQLLLRRRLRRRSTVAHAVVGDHQLDRAEPGRARGPVRALHPARCVDDAAGRILLCARCGQPGVQTRLRGRAALGRQISRWCAAPPAGRCRRVAHRRSPRCRDRCRWMAKPPLARRSGARPSNPGSRAGRPGLARLRGSPLRDGRRLRLPRCRAWSSGGRTRRRRPRVRRRPWPRRLARVVRRRCEEPRCAARRSGGSLYVHLDAHVAHYAKVVLDEVFRHGRLPARDRLADRLGESGFKSRARGWIRKPRHAALLRQGRAAR